MKSKNKEKKIAISLRKKGISINKIAKKLSVATSSVSGWVKDVVLSDEQKSKLKSSNNVLSGTEKWVQQRKADREIYYNQGYNKSKEKDYRHAYCCALYSGEGTKYGNSTIQITNCNVLILKTFISFLRDYFNVPNEKVAINVVCKLSNGISVDDIHNYWLKELNLDSVCIRKHRVRDNVSESNKYPYGICRISVNDVKIRQHIDGAILGYFDDLKK
jgi:predicted transcriptional regulator